MSCRSDDGRKGAGGSGEGDGASGRLGLDLPDALARHEAPAVARVIGLPTKAVRRGSTIGVHGGADATLPTSGPLPLPWRYDDHYGFGSLSGIE